MDTFRIKNLRIGDLLKEYGYVNETQIQAALDYQKEHPGTKIGSALIALGAITEEQMLQALGERLGVEQVDVSAMEINVEAVMKIPRQLAEKYCVLPIDIRNGALLVAVNDPVDLYALEDIRQTAGMQLDIRICKRPILEKAIRYYYAEADAYTAANRANYSVADTEETAVEFDDETPVANLTSSLIRRAYSIGASDIHIEPFEDKTVVRMRIDGTIVPFMTLKKDLHASLIARIKILSELDIAEKRVPQDGHFRITVGKEVINLRVSLIPTVFGEKAVLRLLASNAVIDHSGTFGMREEDYERFERIVRHPNGIIYLTGPTGSGKTTTLYMVLELLSRSQVNISTIEDPVEKNLPRINQMQVNNVAGLTFESGLRALLRQDPDVIMVGETRDRETASISVRAAITGHLVFSTLHTNDAASSVVRLEDMGQEPYMVASSLVGVVAQRLMRKVCPECAEEYEATEEEREYLRCGPVKLKRAVGCTHCNHTGYKGRIAVHEILEVDKTLREMISSGATTDALKRYAVEQQGMRTLREGAVRLVTEGTTTFEELMKVVYYSD